MHRRASTITLVALLLVWTTVARAQPGGQQAVPLTSVSLIADIDTPPYPDDPGTGGGFETQAYFQTRLGGSIGVCLDPIEQATAGWAKDLGLNRALRDRTATALTMHYGKVDLPGFFSVRYQVEQSIKARVRVDYVMLDGTTRSPEFARELLQT